MKAFVFLLCILGCAFAQDSAGVLAQWGGTTQGGKTFFPPNPASLSPCTSVVDARSYVVVNTSLTASGVRQVLLLAEPSFKPYVTVLLYNGTFTSTTPCTNFVRYLTNQNFQSASVGTIDDSVYFAASTTYFLVITSSSSTVGRFSLEIIGSQLSGTTVAGPTWNPSTLNNGSCVATPNVVQTLSAVSWTQTSTGNFDLLALFDVGNGTAPSVYFSLYQGAFTAATIAAGPCLGNLFSAIKITAQEGGRSSLALAYSLTINTAYTIAISNTYSGPWGFQVLPTRLVRATLSGYAQPSRTLPCSPNATSPNAGFYFLTWTAAFQTYFLDTYLIPTYVNQWTSFPTYSFAYSGGVSNTSNPPACPTTAPYIGSAATGTASGPLVFSTSIGRTYTVVISTSSGGVLVNATAAVQVFLFGGITVGNTSSYIPDPNVNGTTTGTTSIATGGTGTSGTTGTTTATTGSKNATSTSGSSTHGPTTTSGVSALTFSVCTLLVALFALLL